MTRVDPHGCALELVYVWFRQNRFEITHKSDDYLDDALATWMEYNIVIFCEVHRYLHVFSTGRHPSICGT